MSRSLRVCYFGTYRAGYSRNAIMVEGLRRAGVEVLTCHVPLWRGIEDRVAAAGGGWKSPGFLWRVIKAYAALLWRVRQIKDFDVLVVGYPGQIDVFPARLVAWLRRKPLVWDVFMSIYLVAMERGLDKASGFTVGALRRLEWLALRLPDRLVQDTEDYVSWLAKTHGIPPDRFGLVPTGADDRVFTPQRPAEGAPVRVIYYGSYIPNHGVEKIVEAARLLAPDPTIEFELIGDGPERPRAEADARRHGLENLRFLGWMDQAELVRHVGESSICLGAFGETPQSLMTVQNKVFEGLAMAKPVLTGDSPAVRRALRHGEHVYLCERSGAGIAEAVRTLAADPALRERLAREGRQMFEREFSLVKIGERFRRILEDTVAQRR